MDTTARDHVVEARVCRILGSQAVEQVHAPIEQASGLPNAAYWSEDWLALEQERLFRRGWVFAAAAAELPRPGDVKPVEVGAVPIILVHGQDGRIRAFQNVCRHRGTQLVREACNRTAITCPYHAWTYRLDGKLKGRPHFHGPGKGDRFEAGGGPDLDLIEVRAETRIGCVFVNLSGDDQPLTDSLAPMMTELEGYDLSALRWAGKLEFDCAANWKLVYENYIENYHVFSLHPRLLDFVPMKLRGAGGWHGTTFCNGYRFPEMEPGRGEGLPHYPGLSPENAGRGIWFLTLPHFAVEVYPDQFTVLVAYPIEPDRTREELHIFLIGEEAASGSSLAKSRQEVFAMWDELNREDLGILTALQQGRRCPGYDGGRLSPHWEQPTLELCRKIVDLILAP